MASSATAVSVFHHDGSAEAFQAWAAQAAGAARSAPGFIESQVSAAGPENLDWATAVTFSTEDELHRWLDSPQRAGLLDQAGGLGLRRLSIDLTLVDGSLPTGVAIFLHTVKPGMEREFLDAEVALVAVSAAFSGFEGTSVLQPGHPGGQWLSILRFRTDHHLQSWMQSAERRGALPELRAQLAEDFVAITRSTPFGSILRLQDGATRVTPKWKTAMLVLLVLYPTVMTLSRFLGPALDNFGAEPWLSMWLSQIVSVGLMTWFLMPVVTGWFRRWLDPVDGAGVRISLFGAGVVVAVYAVTLTLFASVTWLQFWDYID
jgi:antibiotic biosynthesis monooxygenase (ABM) superfamily enzyme